SAVAIGSPPSGLTRCPTARSCLATELLSSGIDRAGRWLNISTALERTSGRVNRRPRKSDGGAQIVLHCRIFENALGDATAAAPYPVGAHQRYGRAPVTAIFGDLLEQSDRTDEVTGMAVPVVLEPLVEQPQEALPRNDLTLDRSRPRLRLVLAPLGIGIVHTGTYIRK